MTVRHTRRASKLSRGLPIDILIEFLLSGILEILGELFSHKFGRDARGRLQPVYGLLGLMTLGAVAGGLVTWLLPQRLLGAPVIPGASLAVAPILNGLLMHAYGVWLAHRNHRESLAASFWGGAVFAFGFALVRFVVLFAP